MEAKTESAARAAIVVLYDGGGGTRPLQIRETWAGIDEVEMLETGRGNGSED